jgi:hypothetical protein
MQLVLVYIIIGIAILCAINGIIKNIKIPQNKCKGCNTDCYLSSMKYKKNL